jgi:hypothetical protein
MAVAQDRRTPHVRELLKEPLSPRAAMMVSILHRRWRYGSKERPTATGIAIMVNLSNQNPFQPLIIPAGFGARRDIELYNTWSLNCPAAKASESDNYNQGLQLLGVGYVDHFGVALKYGLNINVWLALALVKNRIAEENLEHLN